MNGLRMICDGPLPADVVQGSADGSPACQPIENREGRAGRQCRASVSLIGRSPGGRVSVSVIGRSPGGHVSVSVISRSPGRVPVASVQLLIRTMGDSFSFDIPTQNPFHSDNSVRGKASAAQASAPRVTCRHLRKPVERICTHVMFRSSVKAPTVRRKRCRTLASPLLLHIAEKWACLNDNSTPTRFWRERSL